MGRTSKNKKGGVDDYDLNASFDQGPPLTLDDLNINTETNQVNQTNPINQSNQINQTNLPILNQYEDIADDSGPMTIDELQVNPHNTEEGLTDTEMDTDYEDMNGGRKTRRNKKYNIKNTKKQRKINKKRTNKNKKRIMKKKSRKIRKNKNIRGGGYGTNCAQKDPNFSIYNTRELTLFPYKPTNQ